MNDAETGLILTPKFDSAGLVTAVVTDADSGTPLVIAHMNAEAIAKTLALKRVHFYSRSRQSLWLKGETSGHFLEMVEMRVDCDQDALWIRAIPAGPTCHTGQTTCFYRQVQPDGALIRD